MTTELEKQFFDTFGVKTKYYYECKIRDTLVPEDEFTLTHCSQSEVIGFCIDKKYYKSCRVIKTYKEYPEITDRILLELMCIAMDVTDFGASDVETLKNVVLEVLIGEIKSEYSTKKEKKHIVHQVQALFEVNNNDN